MANTVCTTAQDSSTLAAPRPTCTTWAGLLRSRVAPGHGVDEVVGPAVGASGGSGDVGFAVAAVVSDGGVPQDCGDGGAVTGAGLVGVFAQGDIADPVQPILDVPLQPGPVLKLLGLGVLGG